MTSMVHVADGAIRDAEGVEQFLRSLLEGSVGAADLVVALTSRRTSLSGRSALPSCIEIDRMFDAMKSPSEQRSASRQMGRQMLRIATELRMCQELNQLADGFFCAALRDETPGHHAVAFGLLGASFSWADEDLGRALLYSTCSSLVAAALRLLPLGQVAGQRILWGLAPIIARLAEEAAGKDLTDVWNFAPALEIASMQHATLDARLFRS
jgi:urease accessory protein